MSKDRDWEIWNKENIAVMEERWLEQKEYWYTLIKPHLPDKDGINNVLDVGCGVGMHHDVLSDYGVYKGIDITKDMIDRARERLPDIDFEVGDIFNIGYDNIDFVFSWSVLCHLPNEMYSDAIKELWHATNKYLVFNVYIAENNFSFDGSWGEKISGIKHEDLMEILQKLESLHQIRMYKYEDISVQEDVSFQRCIFMLDKFME